MFDRTIVPHTQSRHILRAPGVGHTSTIVPGPGRECEHGADGVRVRRSPRLGQLGARAHLSAGTASEGADRGRARPGSLRRA